MKLKWLIGVAAILAVACATEQSERVQVAGESYGETSGSFRGQWWNYFERGMSYTEAAIMADEKGDVAAKEKALGLAESDLKTAIKMRDMDQRRARTYGMHLIDYFPHRELGIVFYYQGRYDDAVRELETSLSTVESAKAQFYLDKARKAIIERSGGDTSAPGVTLDQLPKLTKETEIEIAGKATDNGFIGEISVGEEAISVPVSQKTIEFRQTVILNEGPNEIKVIARDLVGNVGTAQVTIVSDTTGPSVTISDVLPSTGKTTVKGWVEDTAGVKKFSLENQEVTLKKDGSFEATVQADANGAISFFAEDEVGNTTTGDFEQINRQGNLLFPDYRMDAGNDNPLQIASAIWFPDYVGATPRGCPCGMGRLGGLPLQLAQTSAQGPKIEIAGLTGKQTVYFDSFYVEGYASDSLGVQSLVVGGKSLISKPGQKVYFNYLTHLRVGRNLITFVAKNGNGVAAQKVVEVEYEQPQVRQVGSRIVVSMLPFHLRGQVNLAEAAHEDLLKAVTEGGRFKMVDRSVIDKVVREMKLTQAGLTDQVSAVKAGKLAQAEVVLVGFVNETPRSIEVYARLVDVETSAIIAEKDAYLEAKPLSLKDLISLMNGLSVKIRNQFPLVEGAITSLTGKTLTAQLKFRAPIQNGLKIIIFKEKQVLHPETKKPLGIQTLPVGEARIRGVQGAVVSAELTRHQDLKKVTASDKVITK